MRESAIRNFGEPLFFGALIAFGFSLHGYLPIVLGGIGALSWFGRTFFGTDHASPIAAVLGLALGAGGYLGTGHFTKGMFDWYLGETGAIHATATDPALLCLSLSAQGLPISPEPGLGGNAGIRFDPPARVDVPEKARRLDAYAAVERATGLKVKIERDQAFKVWFAYHVKGVARLSR